MYGYVAADMANISWSQKSSACSRIAVFDTAKIKHHVPCATWAGCCYEEVRTTLGGS